MSHKLNNKKNLLDREADEPIDVSPDVKDVSLDAIKYADTYFLKPAPERLWIGSGDSTT